MCELVFVLGQPLESRACEQHPSMCVCHEDEVFVRRVQTPFSRIAVVRETFRPPWFRLRAHDVYEIHLALLHSGRRDSRAVSRSACVVIMSYRQSMCRFKSAMVGFRAGFFAFLRIIRPLRWARAVSRGHLVRNLDRRVRMLNHTEVVSLLVSIPRRFARGRAEGGGFVAYRFRVGRREHAAQFVGDVDSGHFNLPVTPFQRTQAPATSCARAVRPSV